jgi:lipopolysaccharide/colanic/teichoic acid biosynthesis glycosyltransferase
MITDLSRNDIYTTPTDDPRITKSGKFLRKYNLDELTQFANVLKGDMSIVGPRPEIPQYTELYTEEERTILSVRPGITDLATLWIQDKGNLVLGSDDPEKIYLEKIRPEKIRLQLEYINKKSTRLDIKIMLMTFKTHLLDRLVKPKPGKGKNK